MDARLGHDHLVETFAGIDWASEENAVWSLSMPALPVVIGHIRAPPRGCDRARTNAADGSGPGTQSIPSSRRAAPPSRPPAEERVDAAGPPGPLQLSYLRAVERGAHRRGIGGVEVAERVALSELATVHARSEAGDLSGKVVIAVAP